MYGLMTSRASDAREPVPDARPGPPGSADAEVEELFRAEHHRLLKALYLLTGGDIPEAEDLLQEAFVKVLQHWDRVRRMDDPTGCLYRTAMNAFRSRWRRRTMERLRRPSPAIPADPLQAAEDRDTILRALRALPQRQRLALVLAEFMDRRPDEAAAILRVEEATARSPASQGRARLRRQLELLDE
jgi:RNA polymerase sigma-70 factor (ECF subfamily)